MQAVGVVSAWLREAEVARWASMLATMLANGVDLIKGLQLARESVSLASLRDRLEQVSKLVRTGHSLSNAIASQHAFSDTALSLIQVGEESGELSTMLKSLATLYEDTSRQRMKQFLLLLGQSTLAALALLEVSFQHSVSASLFINFLLQRFNRRRVLFNQGCLVLLFSRQLGHE